MIAFRLHKFYLIYVGVDLLRDKLGENIVGGEKVFVLTTDKLPDTDTIWKNTVKTNNLSQELSGDSRECKRRHQYSTISGPYSVVLGYCSFIIVIGALTGPRYS